MDEMDAAEDDIPSPIEHEHDTDNQSIMFQDLDENEEAVQCVTV